MKQASFGFAIVMLLACPAAPCLAFWGHGPAGQSSGGHAADCGDSCATCGGGACGAHGYAGNFRDYIKSGYRQNQRWPAQYLCADRVTARAPFEIMVRNGWRRQNLLGSHHFTDDASGLSQAGALKVQWILTQAPEQYRQLFVERSVVEGVTEKRLETARQFAATFVGDAPVPPVTDTHLASEGRPAAAVDQVNTQFRQNLRVPALPASTGGAPGGQAQ